MTPSRLRSWLFVPGDDARKREKAGAVGADVLILDLENAVAGAAKVEARRDVQAYLKARPAADRSSALWVRVNPLDQGGGDDLAAVIQAGPDGVMIPKIDDPDDMLEIDARLGGLEAEAGLPVGRIGVAPLIETPRAVLGLPRFGRGAPRLRALTWGAEDLAASLGATRRREGSAWIGAFAQARSGVLLAARAAGVDAVETVYPDFRDLEGLAADSRRASGDGFSGRLAIHPDQVEVLHAAFAPSEADRLQARRILEAFARSPASGVASLDGAMIDAPHLAWARKILADVPEGADAETMPGDDPRD